MDEENSVQCVDPFDLEGGLGLDFLFQEIDVEMPPPPLPEGPLAPPPPPLPEGPLAPPPPPLYNRAFDVDRGYESGCETDCDPRGPIPQGMYVVQEAFHMPNPRGRERSGPLEVEEDGLRDNDSVYVDFDYDPRTAPECLERTLTPEEMPFRFFVCDDRGL